MKPIRQRAVTVNRKIMNLINGPWCKYVNALTVDYFLSTNLIDFAVNTNLYKPLANLTEMDVVKMI